MTLHSRASHALLTAAQPPSVDDDRPGAGDEDKWTLAREEAAQVLADSIEEGWYEPSGPWCMKVGGYGRGESDARLIDDASLAGAPYPLCQFESRFCGEVPPL